MSTEEFPYFLYPAFPNVYNNIATVQWPELGNLHSCNITNKTLYLNFTSFPTMFFF